MKKLMIAVAIVCVAALSQAASAITWGTGTKTEGFVGPDGNTMKNLETYTAICTFFSDSLGASEVGHSSAEKGKTNGSYGTTYGYDVSSRPTEYDFTAGGTYYAQIVISGKDAQGKEWTRSTDIAAFDVSAQGTATLNFYTGTGLSTSGNHWGEWQSVPEPTSGLLLLLGVAGLALRRKQK